MGIFAWLLHLIFRPGIFFIMGLPGRNRGRLPRHLIPAFLPNLGRHDACGRGELLFFWRSFLRGREYALYGLIGYLRVSFTDTACCGARNYGSSDLGPSPACAVLLLCCLLSERGIAEIRLWRRRQLGDGDRRTCDLFGSWILCTPDVSSCTVERSS
jgi:hypothetical protein